MNKVVGLPGSISKGSHLPQDILDGNQSVTVESNCIQRHSLDGRPLLRHGDTDGVTSVCTGELSRFTSDKTSGFKEALKAGDVSAGQESLGPPRCQMQIGGGMMLLLLLFMAV